MNFGHALQKLKDGYKVKRAIWGGYWELSYAEPFDQVIIAWLKDGGAAPAQPYQADLLAEDWEVVS